MPEGPVEHKPTWFEENRGNFQELLDELEEEAEEALAAEKQQLSHMDMAAAQVSGLQSTEHLTAKEYKAAALLGRGCTPEQIQELIAITPTALAQLGENPRFMEKVALQRSAWVNEQMARVQQSIELLEIGDMQSALRFLNALRGLQKHRQEVETARVAMALKIDERMGRKLVQEAAEKQKALDESVEVVVEDAVDDERTTPALGVTDVTL